MIEQLLTGAGGVDIQKNQHRKGNTDIYQSVAELRVPISAEDGIIF